MLRDSDSFLGLVFASAPVPVTHPDVSMSCENLSSLDVKPAMKQHREFVLFVDTQACLDAGSGWHGDSCLPWVPVDPILVPWVFQFFGMTRQYGSVSV